MSNLINAILNIIENPFTNIKDDYSGKNRINNIGEGLESYVKDSFAGTLHISEQSEKLRKYSEVFSYIGNKNNPPDIILRNGDAIEVKKIENPSSALALNSSYPKSKLYSNDPMLTKSCKESENWEEKDIVYVIGYTTKQSLKYIFFIYGVDYSASKDIYERIKHTISDGINNIENVEFSETKELGKVKKVDPLGITDLRIRGMWHIQNPIKVFDYAYDLDLKNDFQLISIINDEKFNSFPEEDKNKILSLNKKGFEYKNIQIKNPNNPAKLVNAKLFVYKVNNEDN